MNLIVTTFNGIVRRKRLGRGSDGGCRERSLAIPVAFFLCCVGSFFYEWERNTLNLSCVGKGRRLLDAAWLVQKRLRAVVCRGGGHKSYVWFLWLFLSYFHAELFSGNFYTPRRLFHSFNKIFFRSFLFRLWLWVLFNVPWAFILKWKHEER